jgi:hypothetical protein
VIIITPIALIVISLTTLIIYSPKKPINIIIAVTLISLKVKITSEWENSQTGGYR